jgi:arylsulfatase A-like enzyme
MNLLLIGVDSLRSDHMSCYGHPRLTTPHIDRLASDGVLFEDAFSPYIPTVPGYTAMLTGTDVMTNLAVSLAPRDPLDPSIRTLAEILGEDGYASACVGFDGSLFRGFDEYRTYDAWVSWEDGPARKAELLNTEALPILESLSDKPFFLFLRHMDPHTPYLPPPPFDRMFYDKDPCDPAVDTMRPVLDFPPFAEFFRSWMPPGITDIDWVVAAYDSSLAYMDACIQRIITRLKELGLFRNTLIVVTSDHGETLTEHGIHFDHHGLYDPTIRIPLIYHLPGRLPRGRRVGGFVLQQDLAPTVLEIMGHGEKAVGMDGRSALPVIDSVRKGNYLEFYLTECTWMRKRGWRTPHYKLIQALEEDIHGKPPLELYDLVEDPGEDHNIADERPEVVRSLEARMEGWVSKRMRETGNPDPILHNRPSFRSQGYAMRRLAPRPRH